MGISPEELIEYYPRLYHMAEDGTWESIKAKGLLSTSALLDLFEVHGSERFDIESKHRPESVKITHPRHGAAVIRDQKPMRETALKDCLTELAPQQWYETLNRRVFFWLTRERLLRLLSARAYRQRKHCVLTVDTKELVNRHLHKITLSPINSGSTIYKPLPRGLDTFLPLARYPFEDRRKTRSVKDSIAELVVDYNLPDVSDFVVRVEQMQGENILQVIYSKASA